MMFGHRRRLRFLSAQMLLVWLFALGSGIASGCGVSAELGRVHGGAHHHPVDAADAPAAPAVHDSPCAKFCDDDHGGVRSEAQVQQSAALVVALLPVLMPVPADPEVAVGEALERREPKRARIPIPIAFLRLAL